MLHSASVLKAVVRVGGLSSSEPASPAKEMAGMFAKTPRTMGSLSRVQSLRPKYGRADARIAPGARET
jgi:hypothetical protein